MRRWYRKFKKRYRLLHVLIMATSIVLFWWGTWNILDLYTAENNSLAWYALGILVAFLLLYIDDFHLKELE